MHDTAPLMRRIEALPPERIAEVEDFVEFIAACKQDRALTRAAASSTPAFAAIWDHADDAAYDAIPAEARRQQGRRVSRPH